MNKNEPPPPPAYGGGDKRIPVTLLTGFLGAGKTTLLNYLVRQPEMAGTALLINEFGEIGIDHHLVERVDETIMVLDSGCICCTVQGDLVHALRTLAERSARRDIPSFSRVLIETTGLADPVPVIVTLSQQAFVAARYVCDGVVTAVDALCGLGQLAHHEEAVRQVAMADRLLITKCDMANGPGRHALDARLRELNPGAAIIEVAHGVVAPHLLLGCGIYTSDGKLPDVAAWLGGEGGQAGQLRSAGPDPVWRRRGIAASHTPERAGGRHDGSVHSFVVTFDAPVAWHAFAVAMGRILQAHGERVLRVKGLMHIVGNPRPLVIQCVQDIAYPPLVLQRWPDQAPFQDRRGRLVFIVRSLPRAEIDQVLASLSDATCGVAAGAASPVPLPTRCWLSHAVPLVQPSVMEVDGWVVQAKRMRAPR